MFTPGKARQLVRRIEFCYTPRHGSWLKIAENELSAMTRQCLNGRRIGNLSELQDEISAWATNVNSKQRGVDWQTLLLVGLSVYLVAAHYIKAYSDPVGFLFNAEAMQAGSHFTRRALVYPALLIGILHVLGPIYVFLSNLPIILVLTLLLYMVSAQLADESNADGRIDKRWVALIAVFIFLLVNRAFLLEILILFANR